MRRKAVTRRLQTLARLRASLEACRDNLGRRLARRPAAPRDVTFSYQPLFDHLDSELLAVERRLAAAEDAYVVDQLEPARLRRRRDEAAMELYDQQHPTRRLLADCYRLGRGGPPGAAGATLAAATPMTGPALTRQVRLTLSLLRRLERRPPAPVPGVSFDPRTLAEALEPRLESFEALCNELIAACAVTDAARDGANHAITQADRVGPPVARLLESLLRLAGTDELADRIRAL